MTLLKFFFRLQPRHMAFAIIAGVLSGVGNILLIATVNSALHGRAEDATFRIAALVALCFLVVFLRFSSDLILIRLSEKLVYELRIRLSQQILAVPLRHLEILGPHPLFATLTEDVGRLAELSLNIPNVCVNAAIVLAGLFYLLFLSPPVMLCVLIAIVVGVTGYKFIRSGAIRHFRRARDLQDDLMRHFRALTDGVKEMKLNSIRKTSFVTTLEGTAQALRSELVTGDSIFELALSWAQLAFFTLISLLIVLAPSLRSSRPVPTVLSGTVLVLLFIRGPMEAIIEMVMNLTQAQVSLSKIDQLGLSLTGDVEESQPDCQETIQCDSAKYEIEMRGVTYSYHSETEFTLGPFDLIFRAGEIVFISGGNGSGKTTFLKLLTGLYVPDSGVIRFSDTLITPQNRDSFRSTFSVVFSDFHLADRIARPSCSELDEIAAQYLREVRLDHKVSIKNGVFSATDLSYGQRKRLALVAACLEDKPIYVFDEWAADQDASFRHKFYYQILPELKHQGKTLFVITHDQQFFDVADRLLVLDEGRLWKDTGNGDELCRVVSQMKSQNLSPPRRYGNMS
jgi:putative pyoverdin transport system ATP-binding/permease protein